MGSAALYAAAFPPWNVDLLAWIALVPLLWALRGLSAQRAAAAGLLWGTAAIWIIGYWVPVALSTYWAQPVWFGIAFATVASAVFVGSYGAGFAICAALIIRRWSGAKRSALLAATWVSWEVARGRLLTGDPWLLIGYAPVSHPVLIQAADIGGIYLVSFVVALVNAALFECFAGEWSAAAALRVGLPALGLLAAVSFYGWWRLETTLPQTPVMPLLVVQGNNDLGGQWREEYYGRGLETYLRLSTSGAAETHPRLIIWPESSMTFFFAQDARFREVVHRMLAGTGADLVAGAPYRDGDDTLRPRFYNSAFYLKSNGEIAGRYDKVHLMPFGEYFPLRTIEFLRRRFERVRYFTPADQATMLQTDIGAAAVVICFEAIFPELVRDRMARGGEFLVNLSNDAWLGHGAGPEKHLVMVIPRAVENRTWIVRATTTGVSALVDPYGRVVSRTDTGVATSLSGSIVPMRITTLYERIGDAFAYLCVAISLIALLFAKGR